MGISGEVVEDDETTEVMSFPFAEIQMGGDCLVGGASLVIVSVMLGVEEEEEGWEEEEELEKGEEEEE